MDTRSDIGAPIEAGRQLQKAATRARVVEAARALFDEVGYQSATIREIARRAGVSVGSVFTTFASKGEILSEVMQGRLAGLYAELDRIVPHLRGSTADRLCSLYSIVYAFEMKHIRLFLWHIANAYDWTLAPDAQPFGRNRRIRTVLRDCLEQGVAAEDVRSDADLDEIVDMLIGLNAWTYQRVITEGADAKTLSALMEKRIRMLMAGFAARNMTAGIGNGP